MSSRGKILVIRGGAIGDFILTLPALSALRRQFPNVHLEVIGYPHVADLAVAGKVVDRVRSIESRALAGFFARRGELSAELTDYFSTFDIIISYLYDPDKIFESNVRSCSKAQFIAAPHRPNEMLELHATKVFLEPLQRLAIFDADPIPHLSLNSERKILNQIALHPGSGSERKNWPQTKWAQLVTRLYQETDFKLLLIAGEAEAARARRLSANLPMNRFELAENLPLVEVAAHLQNSAGFVGHDSGISHLAAALGVPGIVLWGDTVEAIWRPETPGVRILRAAQGLSGISVDEVFSELMELA